MSGYGLLHNQAAYYETAHTMKPVREMCGAMMFISIVAASIGGAFATFGRKLWAVIAG